MSESRSSILLVDDEVIVLKSAKRLLEKKGYAVLTAEDGEGAMEILKARHTEIGVILLDLSMPGMDGEETLENMLEIDPEAKIILFSGYSRSQELDTLFEKGAVDHIQKPFDINDLITTLNRFVK
jgi:CheY-like chemotaxis protein